MIKIYYLLIVMLVVSCKRQNDWLDVEKSKSEIILEKLDDYQAVLDNTQVFNIYYPTIGLLSSDNFFIPPEVISSLSLVEKNAYLWEKEIDNVAIYTIYLQSYGAVSRANKVLEGMEELTLTPADVTQYNAIKGQALFFRGLMFLDVATLFSKQYNPLTANSDLGICLKLHSNINTVEPRSSVQKTYEQIGKDLRAAADLLPQTMKYKTRPSKQAAYALLARLHLVKGEYQLAKDFADSVLRYSNELLDFNGGMPNFQLEYRFNDFNSGNKEVIFFAEGYYFDSNTPNANAVELSYVDTALYNSYDVYDLRRDYFFSSSGQNLHRFRGNYTGREYLFAGIGINEVIFTRAECNARLGNLEAALADLNYILQHRYQTGKYTKFSTSDPRIALVKILEERNKELPFTGQIRWQDLRRLNLDPGLAKSLSRISADGSRVTLQPNDARYVFPIPQEEIVLSGIEQNIR